MTNAFAHSHVTLLCCYDATSTSYKGNELHLDRFVLAPLSQVRDVESILPAIVHTPHLLKTTFNCSDIMICKSNMGKQMRAQSHREQRFPDPLSSHSVTLDWNHWMLSIAYWTASLH
eukprot:4483117-Amphidinium_carterae.1